MNIETFRNYCLNKPGTGESFPFNENILVMKVISKMYALTDVENTFAISLKCPEEQVIKLSEEYTCIEPAPHFNKKYWIKITPDHTISDELIFSLIDQSYNLVKSKLTKKEQSKIK